MQALNMQPPQPKDIRADGSLDVFKIWFTIQGEGPFSGMPSVFIRLAGCNLQCPTCDTDYTSNSVRMAPETITDEVVQLILTSQKPGTPLPLVVITGGEPFRQNLTPLVGELAAHGFRMQIETNGTEEIPQGFDNRVTIVCSPKTPKLHASVVNSWKHLKYVLRHDNIDPLDGLPTSSLGMSFPPARPDRMTRKVFVSPEDSGDTGTNKRNTAACVESAMRYGYRVSLQTHKLLGVE